MDTNGLRGTKNTSTRELRTRSILLGVLLVLVAALALFVVIRTIDAIQVVHHNADMARRDDVGLIQSWMTIPYIARVYHIPASVLYTQLHLPDDATTHHQTLQDIALARKEKVKDVVQTVQGIVSRYRQTHPLQTTGTP
jgi:hypothetical protein